jgi:hypothetical protein
MNQNTRRALDLMKADIRSHESILAHVNEWEEPARTKSMGPRLDEIIEIHEELQQLTAYAKSVIRQYTDA